MLLLLCLWVSIIDSFSCQVALKELKELIDVFAGKRRPLGHHVTIYFGLLNLE